MPFNFYKPLKENDTLKDMPPVKISFRKTDKYITYRKNMMRFDSIAGEIYEDETLWRLILWGNPEYFIEFDIPDNTIIRIPYPLNDVLAEVNNFIINNRDK
jgi:hypothetical protein